MVHPVMRALVLLLIVVAGASTALAQEADPYVVVLDQYMSPAAGAQDLLTLQHELAAVEDRWIPLKVGQERSRPSYALGILYRGTKFLMFDVPQDHFLMVVAHEVFGHGARFRELGEGTLTYGFDAPIPYGSGDAFTKFVGQFPVSPLADLNVSAAGIEAQHALADGITDRAVARGRLHYREAWLYFESRMAALNYMLSASPHSSPGHDVAGFIETFEDQCEPPCSPLTRKYVQQRALIALADPMLYTSIYAFAGAYIGGASTTGPVPMIALGRGTRILPSLGYAMAPYGTEWTVRSAVTRERRAESKEQGEGKWLRINVSDVRHIAVRIGDTGATTTWGVAARLDDVLQIKRLRIGAKVDVWRQPHMFADHTYGPLRTGAAVTGTTILPLPRALRTRWSNGIYAAAGYKAQGYVPAEQISGGAFLRAGVALR